MSKRQSGFTIVEVLLCIIAVTLFVGIGMYGYNSIKDKNDTKNTVSNKVTKAEDGNTSNEYFEFPELNVKVVLPDDLKDISYTVDGINREQVTVSGKKLQETTAIVSSKRLTDLCEAQQGEAPLAYLSKTEGTFDVVVQASDGASPGDYFPGELFKQFDAFFIDGRSGSGNSAYAGCENIDAVRSESTRLIDLLKEAFKDAEQI